MLLALKIKNFLSLEEETTISFLSSTFNDEKEIINKNDILSKIAFLGNNNSGKSNILKSIKVIKEYFLKNDRHFLKNTTFITNIDKESKLELTFINKSNIKEIYVLGLIYKKDLLIKEYAYINKNLKSNNYDLKLYEYDFINHKFVIDDNNDNKNIDYIENKEIIDMDKEYKNEYSSLSSFLSFKINSNLSFKNEDLNKYFFNAYEFLKNELIIFDPLSSSFLNKRINLSSFSLTKFNNLINEFDLGINEAKFKKINEYKKMNLKEKEDIIFNKLYLMSNSIYKYVLNKNNKKRIDKYELLFLDQNIDYLFNINEVSLGSKKLIILLIILSSLKSNKTYIFDEIDISLHPFLFEKYLKVFNKENTYYSQIIFSTHYIDSIIYLDNESIYLVTKKDSKTKINGLIEYKNLTSKEEIIKKFKEGRYLGIPNI